MNKKWESAVDYILAVTLITVCIPLSLFVAFLLFIIAKQLWEKFI
jgi:hypothetical protein